MHGRRGVDGTGLGLDGDAAGTRLLLPPGHERFVTGHTEDALRGAGIAEVLDLAVAAATSEAIGAKGLIAGQDGEILNLLVAGVAAVGAIVADQRSIAQQEQVCVRVQQGAAGVAAKATDMPSIAGCVYHLSMTIPFRSPTSRGRAQSDGRS